MRIVTHRRYSVNPPPSEWVRATVTDWAPVYEALGVTLRGRGAWLAGRCPLHDDRSPSLSVHRGTGYWRCHAGCGSGSVFDLAARLRELTFGEAVRYVADLAGVRLDPPRRRSSGRGWRAWR